MEEIVSTEEILTMEEIFARIRKDLLKGIAVVISPSPRLKQDDDPTIKSDLINIKKAHPQLADILDPLIEDADVDLDCCADIKFKLTNNGVEVKIKLIEAFQDETKMSSKCLITLEVFDLFCHQMQDFCVFMTDNGETLLSDL